MSQEATELFAIRLTKEQVKKLSIKAESRKTSKAKIVKELIDDLDCDREPNQTGLSRFDLLLIKSTKQYVFENYTQFDLDIDDFCDQDFTDLPGFMVVYDYETHIQVYIGEKHQWTKTSSNHERSMKGLFAAFRELEIYSTEKTPEELEIAKMLKERNVQD